jgi:hypothetical protein
MVFNFFGILIVQWMLRSVMDNRFSFSLLNHFANESDCPFMPNSFSWICLCGRELDSELPHGSMSSLLAFPFDILLDHNFVLRLFGNITYGLSFDCSCRPVVLTCVWKFVTVIPECQILSAAKISASFDGLWFFLWILQVIWLKHDNNVTRWVFQNIYDLSNNNFIRSKQI